MTTITKLRTYRSTVRPGQLTDGTPCFVAEHPDIDGAIVHGATEREALDNLEQARELILASMIAANEELPKPSGVSSAIMTSGMMSAVPAAVAAG